MRLLFIKTFSDTINHTRTYHHHLFHNNFYKCLSLPTEHNRLNRRTEHLGYKMSKNNPRVLIIGAGAAGIAAACRLHQQGVTDVTVLEAEDRIGGRIHSVEFGGGVVDLGAQWCHGEEDNVVFEMVRDLGVLGESFNDYRDNTYYESSGNVVERNVSDELLGIALGIVGDEEEMIECDRPFGEYFIERYNKAVEQQFASNETHLKIAREMLDWFHRFVLCLDASATWFDITAAGSLHYKECAGNLLLNWKQSGFKTIIDILLKNSKFPVAEKILLNKQVDKITWNTSDSVTVQCADGATYNASHVIVTVSVGVLQETHQKLFTPKLPLYKQNAIEGWSLGAVGKILLKFRSRWWPADCRGFSLIWTKEDREGLIKEFPYGPSENGRSWLEDVFGFYVIDSNPDVLLGWIVGKHVQNYELLSDEIVVEGCLYLLRKFLGGLYNVEKPESVLRSKWCQNPNFRGSYSYRGLEAEKRGVSPLDLARPLINSEGKEVVLFAGEATHPFYYSTVHGAVETGFREADRILSTIKHTKQNVYTVAIVGAGISGLAAAKELLDSGCENIVILEAQDRVGGRIHTITTDDGIALELGAQWIHGKRNPIYNLATKNALIAGEKSGEARGIYVRDDGVVFEEDLVEKVEFEVGKILLECEKFVAAVDYPDSVGDFLGKHFAKYVEKSQESASVKQKMLELFDWHVRFQIIDNSCTDLKRVSAKEWGRYEIYNGQDHINLKTGYKGIVDVLLENLPKNCLKLKTPVEKIKCKDFVTLQTANNEEIRAKHVILTPSLGVLRSLLYEIHPPLPVDMCKAIKNMGFHGIGKVYLIYDSKWWSFKGVQLVWRENSGLSEEEGWMRHMTGFDEIWNHPTALLGWIGGGGVEKMEGLSEEEIGVHCTSLLQKFLGSYCDKKIPLPKKVIRTRWMSNSFVRGSYCNTSAACDELNVGIDNLRKPVFLGGEPKILLAGEAVHKTHFSTVHGAFESGQQQARVLLDYIKKENKLCKL